MITKKDAVRIAKADCERHGLTWRKDWEEHVTVNWGFFTYTVVFGEDRGTMLFVEVRKKDGVVLGEGHWRA